MADQLPCLGVEFYDLGKEILGSGASVRLRLWGWSMYPLIRHGDVVELAPAGIEQVQVGDIVLFRSGRRLLAHRIVRCTFEGQRTSLVPRGDNALTEDGPIRDKADLLGQVRAVWRDGREIRLDRGLAGHLGRFIARNKAAHYLVCGLTRSWWRCGRLVRRTLRLGGGRRTKSEEGLSTEVER